MTKAKQTIDPGAIFAIPRTEGGFYFVVHLESNRFGSSFGILQGFNESPQFSDAFKVVALNKYIYTGTKAVRNGNWKAAGSDSKLLGLFPEKPEIFHQKAFQQASQSIGEFGSAESAEGVLRDLTESEANDVFLSQPPYRQIMIETEFEVFLHKLLG